MANRRIDVFFCGLFMDPEVLRSKGASPQNIRRARAPGFALRIGSRATLWPDPNTSAYGMLYSENSVRAYRPEAILVHLDDGPGVPVLTFNLVESPHLNEHNSEETLGGKF